MSLSLASQQHLPDHCQPTNEFLTQFSAFFYICIPTPLAFVSTTLGLLSIVAWLFAQLPQIYKNWSIQSTSGLSIFFLVEWCLGDLSNLLGALFTHQATWQVTIGAYYVFVDLCLVGQWIWYERLKHGRPVFVIWKHQNSHNNNHDSDAMTERPTDDAIVESPSTKAKPTPRIVFRAPSYQSAADSDHDKSPGSTGKTRITRSVTSSSPFPYPSPRTTLLIACIIAMVQASPIQSSEQPMGRLTTVSSPTPLEQVGTVLSWISTLLYLASRLPQLLLNFRRKSTAGLSPHLFMAAFVGNLCYSTALATNPAAWTDMGPWGGHGWAGSAGSRREEWVGAALPFFLGAAGVLALDASVGVQFLLYGEEQQKLVVVREAQDDAAGGTVQTGHWRRVSGWMRGWIPSMGEEASAEERAALVSGDTNGSDQRAGAYGTI